MDFKHPLWPGELEHGLTSQNSNWRKEKHAGLVSHEAGILRIFSGGKQRDAVSCLVLTRSYESISPSSRMTLATK